MLGHKPNLSKYGRNKIMEGRFSYGAMKLMISDRKEFGKFTIRLKITHSLKSSGSKRSSRRLKKCFKVNEKKHNLLKIMGYR